VADIFAPLTPAERTTGTAPSKPEPVPIVPVPEDAPACAWRHPKYGLPVAKWPYHEAGGRLVAYAARVEYLGADGKPEKAVLPVTYCRVGHVNGRKHSVWRSRGVPAPRPLYHLPELLAAAEAPVIVTEGEKKADPVPELFPDFLGTTSMGGAKAAKLSDWTPLAGRRVVIWPDNDEAGRHYAEDVARLAWTAGAASVAIVAVPADWPERWDLADPLPDGASVETLARLLAGATPWTPPAQPQPSGAVNDNAQIAQLAQLSTMAYEREREAAARRLGIRVSILDKAVAAERSNGCPAPGQGRPLDFPEIEPWPEPVAGAALLEEMARAIRRHVVLDAHEADAVALWGLAVHAFDAWTIFPRLFVMAPEKQCGKSTLLEIVSLLVPRPQAADSITAAALFRTIEAACPTLLLDEADTYARDNEDMRCVLDSGHKRGGSVVRTVGDNHEPRRFSTWAPVAFAAIGHLAGTVEDRSIIIRLRRRRPDEAIGSLRQGRTSALDTLARKAARCARDHLDGLRAADPAMPSGLYNRAADNWLPLLAVADAAGGVWPARARDAVAVLIGAGADDSESVRVKVLADIHAAFRARDTDRIASEDLVGYLTGLDERPWPEYRNGKPITKAQIARLLKPLRISSGTIRLNDERTAKGYYRAAFEDAFTRYIPGFQKVTTSQAKQSAALGGFQSVTSLDGVTFRNHENTSNSGDCDGVTFQNAGNGNSQDNDADARTDQRGKIIL
jgi:hypothetical protein